MEEDKEISLEEWARMECDIRSNKYGLDNILNIDKLIIVNPKQDGVLDLKNSISKLSNVRKIIDDDLKDLWDDKFNKQARFSVNKIKELKNREES